MTLFYGQLLKDHISCRLTIYPQKCCNTCFGLFQRFLATSSSQGFRKTTGTNIPLHQAQVLQVRSIIFYNCLSNMREPFKQVFGSLSKNMHCADSLRKKGKSLPLTYNFLEIYYKSDPVFK